MLPFSLKKIVASHKSAIRSRSVERSLKTEVQTTTNKDNKNTQKYSITQNYTREHICLYSGQVGSTFDVVWDLTAGHKALMLILLHGYIGLFLHLRVPATTEISL